MLRFFKDATPSPGALPAYLRRETTGGKLLLLATAAALLWANAAESSYAEVWGTHVGPQFMRLDLDLRHWASDGLLALFFFVAGMEVKRELTVGEISSPRQAALPIMAALGGIVVPAGLAIVLSSGDALDGGAWAVPVATDIAFALGVLALAGSALPSGVRVLLLSMAVIDDLVAIALIAVLFTSGVEPWALALAGALCALYWASFRLRFDTAWLLWPLALAVWILLHRAGVHATVAGILLGLLTPVRPRPGERQACAERFEHVLHPVSAGLCVPLFALASTGIVFTAPADVIGDRVVVAIGLALLVGKLVGILGGALLARGLRIGRLPDEVRWADVVPVALLGGIGYTVSLLIVGLAFADDAARDRASIAVLTASVLASLGAVALLRFRTRAHAGRPSGSGG